MLQLIENFITTCIQSFANLSGSLELTIILFTLLIRLLIMPFKYPVDLNYLKKSATKKYFDGFLQFEKMTKDPSLIKNLRRQQKKIRNNLKVLTFSRMLLLISIQVLMLILFVKALTRLDDGVSIAFAQGLSLEYVCLVGLLLLLTSIDYFIKQCLVQQDNAGYILPFILCLLMLCSSFFFTELFLFYLVTTFCFNIISFYLIWLVQFSKVKLQVYRVFLDFFN